MLRHITQKTPEIQYKKKKKIKKFIDTMQDYNKADMMMCWQSLGTEGFKSHSSTGECSGCVLSHNKNEALLFDRNYLQKKEEGNKLSSNGTIT